MKKSTIDQEGSQDKNIPEFIQQFIHLDLRNNENAEKNCNDLLLEIINAHEMEKPKPGARPSFE